MKERNEEERLALREKRGNEEEKERERGRAKESNQFAAIVFVLPPECAMNERCPIRYEEKLAKSTIY